MKKLRYFLCILCIPFLSLLLVGCKRGQSSTVTVTPPAGPFDSSPIPMLTEEAVPPRIGLPADEALGSSPILKPTQSLGPGAGPPAGQDWKAFAIHEPLIAGDTQVSGEGPAGLEIAIVDVTDMGRELGRGKILPDGTFKMDIQSPLIGNHGIGVMILSDLSSDTILKLDKLRGPRSISLPRIGDVYVMVMVHDRES